MSNKRSTTASCLLILMAILAGACDDNPAVTPTPSENLEGVIIYSRDNFNFELDQGDADLLRNDVSDLRARIGPCMDTWDDCISSIELSDGWRATLYERDGFEGDSLRVVTSYPDLDEFPRSDGVGDWDNRASSIRVIRP